MSENTEYIIITDDRLWRSALRDVVTLASVVGIIGIGWFLDSSAMQWAGFVVAALMLIALAGASRKRRKTPQEAAKYLRDKFGVTASSVIAPGESDAE